jgi:hypothetical protein
LAAIVVSVLASWAAASSAQPARADAAPVTGAAIAHDLGMWNYDQPDRQNMTNIAVITCPAGEASCGGTPPIVIPQIGYVVFSAGLGGTVIGHTDQGCMWRFAAHHGGLELSPAPQYCFNHVIGSGYTITRWSVTFSGRHETEFITAISHLPYGDFDFTLQDGRRTKAGNGPGAAHRFAGDWRYDPANPQTGVNFQTIQYAEPDGQVKVVQSAVTGQIAVTDGLGPLITARTGDGCRWTLVARGNTAELWPAHQTCRLGHATETLSFWSIASNGTHQISIMAGINRDGGSFLLVNGSLTRTEG